MQIHRPDAITHLAALVSVTESQMEPELNYRLNIEASYVMAEAARRFGVPRLVFASSAAVYGASSSSNGMCPTLQPLSPYGAAKAASELLLRGYATAHSIVIRIQRYFNVFGPRQDPSSPYSGVISIFAARARTNQPVLIYGDGLQTRDFVFVRDVAQANLKAVCTPDLASGVADICTGRSIDLLETASLIGRRFSNGLRIEFGPARLGDIRHFRGNPDPAKQELGFTAGTSLEDGLKEMLNPVEVDEV